MFYGGGPYPTFIKYQRDICLSGSTDTPITCVSGGSNLWIDVNKWKTDEIPSIQCDGLTEVWITVPSGNAKIGISNIYTAIPLEVFSPAEPYPNRPLWDAHGEVVADAVWEVAPLGGISQTVYVRYMGPWWTPPTP